MSVKQEWENRTFNYFYKIVLKAYKLIIFWNFLVSMTLNQLLGHYYHTAALFDCLLIDSSSCCSGIGIASLSGCV